MFWEIEAEPIWTSVENFPIRSIFQVNEKYKKKVSKSVKLISKFAKRTHTHIHTHTHTHKIKMQIMKDHRLLIAQKCYESKSFQVISIEFWGRFPNNF